MESFRLGQLTKELVAAKLRTMDDPCAAAAEIVRATVSVALRGTPDNPSAWPAIIKDACQGGITGLLLSEQNVAKGATLMLHAVGAVAVENHMDPTEAMAAALQGIADLKRFMLPEKMCEVKSAIDAEFMGAGECLSKLLDGKPAMAN
ncbi:MAG: hypothetical protein HY925_00775 [Elusimicrobia bacterium]|nr:hypothetical protein [Elusimicrobiota bacterium]